MSVIYQVWWGRRSLAETFWFWGIVVSVLLIDVPYWVSYAWVARWFSEPLTKLSRALNFYRVDCSDYSKLWHGLFIYVALALLLKLWLIVGIWRSRTRVRNGWTYALKSGALLVTIALVPFVIVAASSISALAPSNDPGATTILPTHCSAGYTEAVRG